MEAIQHYYFCLQCQVGSAFKGNKLLLGCDFFPLKVNLILEGLCLPKKQTGNKKSLVLFHGTWILM